MKISINYIRKFLDFDLPPITELVDIINAQLGALEEGVINLGEVYKDVTVAKVLQCQPIEGSDHLNLCTISDGGRHKDSHIRDANGNIQVVCGAPNVAAGQLVAWLPHGSVVPSTYYKDQVVLESKELRGNISHGMIASPKELMIDDDHSGILVIDIDAKEGDSFAKVYELDDYILDIENKMFTHRPDCFGLLGIAREVAGILNKPFKSPEWYINKPEFKAMSGIKSFKVENEIPSLVPRFSGVSMDNVTTKQSPILIRSYLSRLGIRPLNSIVDATNLAMIESGQPLHAYDYDKLVQLSGGTAPVITVRNPMSSEKVHLINDRVVEPSPEAIVIAAKEPVGLGGIMGSSNSAISESTKTIIIESACFDMYSIRKTSMQLGIFSDAVTRFTKGQSPLQTARVLKRASDLIRQINGEEAVISSDLVDNIHLDETTISRDSLYPTVKSKITFINERLGTDLPAKTMSELLNNVECKTSHNDSELDVTSPFWRTDLEIREDIVEEVGRLYGYDRIKMQPIRRFVSPPEVNAELQLKAKLRSILSSLGANELLTYSFVSDRLLHAVSQDVGKAYKLANPLSPDVQFYRLSLIPSLLSKVNLNIKAGYSPFAIFEIGRSYIVDTEVPSENKAVSLVYAAKDRKPGASYYAAREYLVSMTSKLSRSDIDFIPWKKEAGLPKWLEMAAKPFNQSRSAIVIGKDKEPIGIVGEFNPKAIRELKLPYTCAGFEINLDALYPSSDSSSYHKLSKYPSVKQDITLKVPGSVDYGTINSYLYNVLMEKTKEHGHFTLSLVSIYSPKYETGHKNYTFRVVLTDYTTTLKDNEVNQLLDDIASGAKDKIGATRI